MAILVVGSVAFDSIETPHGKVDHCLGGAATHFALAASYFTPVRVIAVVGKDFSAEHEAVLTRRGIDTQGIERSNGLSFHWTGSYSGNMDEAKTLGTDLNALSCHICIPDMHMEDSEKILEQVHEILEKEFKITHTTIQFERAGLAADATLYMPEPVQRSAP